MRVLTGATYVAYWVYGVQARQPLVSWLSYARCPLYVAAATMMCKFWDRLVSMAADRLLTVNVSS